VNAAAAKDWLNATFELGDHNRRLPSMEGLRGLAILLVFASHYHDIIGEHLALAGPLAALSRIAGVAGGTGVDLFFLLSGFLIYRTTLHPALNVGAFLLRRAERIYPTFIVVFAAFVALGAIHLGPSRLPPGVVHGLATIVSNLLFMPGIFDLPAIINAAWSLSYEWFFYLVLPIAVLCLQMHRWSRTARIVFFAAICVIFEGLCLLTPALFPTFGNFEGSHIRLLMFVCGMIVYELLESERFCAFFRGRVETICIAAGALAGVALLARIAYSAGPVPVTFDPSAWSSSEAAIQIVGTFIGFGSLGLVVLRNDGLLARFFTGTWLRWTGNISYSFYLVHSIPMHFISLVVNRGAAHVSPALLYIIALPVTLAITWAVSALLFVTVEKPLSLRPRRAARTRTDQQAA